LFAGCLFLFVDCGKSAKFEAFISRAIKVAMATLLVAKATILQE
jgi:hypothetical protein